MRLFVVNREASRVLESKAERMALGDFFLREVTEKGRVLYARTDARVD